MSYRDAVTLFKNLKKKGSSFVDKIGIMVKNIHLVAGDHNIDRKIDGIEAIQLKSECLKKG